MQKRVFRGAMLIALLSALFVALVGAISDYVSAGRETESRLWQEARLLAALSDALQEEEAFLNAVKSLPLTERVTWLDEDGVVRYDIKATPPAWKATWSARKSNRHRKRGKDGRAAIRKPY